MDLRTTVRACVDALERGGEHTARRCVEPIRVALAERGLAPGCHAGRKDLADKPEETLEWYAGQVLHVIDSESWVAVNAIINCLDKFCPEKVEG